MINSKFWKAVWKSENNYSEEGKQKYNLMNGVWKRKWRTINSILCICIHNNYNILFNFCFYLFIFCGE